MTDRRDLPALPQQHTVKTGGLTMRDSVARDALLKLLETGKRPASMRQEDVDRWAEGLALLSVTLSDALFDYLDSPPRVSTAQERQEARDADHANAHKTNR